MNRGPSAAGLPEIELPLDQLEIDPDNVRTEYDPDIVAGLRSALGTTGDYINPPTVYPVGPNHYRVKHGSTRVLAAQGVVKSLRVRVVDPPPNETSKLLVQMSENLLQGSLRPADVGNALKRLRQADGHERSLSQVVGALKAAGVERTKSWVAMHLALAELAPAVQRLINQGRLPAEAGYHLRFLPQDQQVEWAQRVVREGISREELRRQLSISEDVSGEPSTEVMHRDFEDRLAQVAAEFDGEHGTAAGARRDAGDRHTSGAVSVRRELLPLNMESTDTRTLKRLDGAEWARKATDVERQLAQEVLFFGRVFGFAGDDLVERTVREIPQASERVILALNALRNVIEHPGDLMPDSALAEFMAIRARRVLSNIRPVILDASLFFAINKPAS